MGEAIGPPPSEVSLIRPKNAAALASPFLIGRNSQRPGTSVNEDFSDAARSGVRLRQIVSLAQIAA